MVCGYEFFSQLRNNSNTSINSTTNEETKAKRTNWCDADQKLFSQIGAYSTGRARAVHGKRGSCWRSSSSTDQTEQKSNVLPWSVLFWGKRQISREWFESCDAAVIESTSVHQKKMKMKFISFLSRIELWMAKMSKLSSLRKINVHNASSISKTSSSWRSGSKKCRMTTRFIWLNTTIYKIDAPG